MFRLMLTLFVVAQAVTPQCSPSSSSSSPVNTMPIVVNAGPANDFFNGAFVSVTLCVPGTSDCQTIDGILVDTGSSGLRVLASALTLALPQQNGAGGAPIAECGQFTDGFTWGPVQTADIKLAGELARSVPIQAIGAQAFATVPPSCSSAGTPENTLADLGANGILGVGPFRQDCGAACTFAGSSNPAVYYVCASGSCQATTEALTEQLQNPIWRFSSDNNGVVLQLPTVPIGGALSTAGAMRFGVGSQGDNALGAAQVQTTDASGNFTTVFSGQSYSAYIDSGSNGLFWLDSTTTGLPICTVSTDFYCPPSLRAFSATNHGVNGTTAQVTFNIGNADALSDRLTAFSEIGGPNPGNVDWGLPFFYGRTVFIAIEGQSTSAGPGPYFAY